jgi:ElaB/YqjD/DUF883 family membrane-anchored ribosome-binding protein
MYRQESGRFGADQNAGPDVSSTQGDVRSAGQPQGQGNIVDAAKDKIQQLASQARETAGQQAESRFSDGKTRATQTLGTVAQTLKSSSQQLRDQKQDAIGKYADQAASKIEEISHYLENATLNDVATRVENFARREPALFIGSAVALGFIGARFLKSSRRDLQGGAQMRQGFDQSARPMGDGQGYQNAGGSWQSANDLDVTPTPRREWTSASSESQPGSIEDIAGRTGRI